MEESWRNLEHIEFDNALFGMLDLHFCHEKNYNSILKHFTEKYHTDCNILLCAAVQKCQAKLANWLIVEQRLFDSGSDFQPLITAVFNRNTSAINYFCQHRYYDFYLNVRGYGKMQENKLYYNYKLSAPEIVLENDDLELLTVLAPYCRGELDALYEMARGFNARKCMCSIEYTFTKEINESWPRTPPRLRMKFPRQIDSVFQSSPGGEDPIFQRLIATMMFQTANLLNFNNQAQFVSGWRPKMN